MLEGHSRQAVPSLELGCSRAASEISPPHGKAPRSLPIPRHTSLQPRCSPGTSARREGWQQIPTTNTGIFSLPSLFDKFLFKFCLIVIKHMYSFKNTSVNQPAHLEMHIQRETGNSSLLKILGLLSSWEEI